MIRNFLVAEDDDEDVDLYREAITNAGLPIRISRVMQCDHVLFRLSIEDVPDLVILDNSLPGKTLFECIGSIRKQFAVDQLPVILLSNSIHATFSVNGYVAGFNLVLEKPQSFNELQSLFRKLLIINWKENPVISPSEFKALAA